ncbi:alpha/beta hydrolase [Pseudomonas sp. ABC1]|uniref:RBBP9/YdeN family alpha/beta hydrolase n=1 Tax=Pseudomonas sp. ABC1 TaxID=2748080 RepID=UPI0015C34204|nr:alpha/beta hydrolase [Pseudomonas sp. ABC1]QLF93971.1 alpha/beta hydrolase [Pseudomonas sp. ABC1]
MTRVLILPGRGNSGDKHWQTFWERSHPEYQRVLQREWDNPHIDDWVETLNQAINADSSPVVLVAHSLSVALVAHWAARHRGPVSGALLVAPSDVEQPAYPAGAEGFAPMPLQALGFPAIVVASSDDERVSLVRARQFAEAWGARLDVPGAFGHLGSLAELRDWPYGAERLEELLARR